jgi:DNA mismatch repair protein MutS
MTKASTSLAPSRELIARHDADAATAAVRNPPIRADASRATGESFALVMAQYLEFKTANPDHILFCRAGDFYVLFFEDAKIASRTVGLALIKRTKLMGTGIPMCAAPLERSDDYVQRLLVAGYGVAICEQIEDPATAAEKGGTFVVRRDVVRLITPARVRRRRPR